MDIALMPRGIDGVGSTAFAEEYCERNNIKCYAHNVNMYKREYKGSIHLNDFDTCLNDIRADNILHILSPFDLSTTTDTISAVIRCINRVKLSNVPVIYYCTDQCLKSFKKYNSYTVHMMQAADILVTHDAIEMTNYCNHNNIVEMPLHTAYKRLTTFNTQRSNTIVCAGRSSAVKRPEKFNIIADIYRQSIDNIHTVALGFNTPLQNVSENITGYYSRQTYLNLLDESKFVYYASLMTSGKQTFENVLIEAVSHGAVPIMPADTFEQLRFLNNDKLEFIHDIFTPAEVGIILDTDIETIRAALYNDDVFNGYQVRSASWFDKYCGNITAHIYKTLERLIL